MSTVLRMAELRAGSAADVPLVAAIMAEAFDPRFGEAWTAQQCLGILSLPGVWLTLAEVAGEPAGFALARTVLDEGELLLLATRPRHRRQGIGTALLRSVISDAKHRGSASIHLEVRLGNPAIALYRAENFIKVGERKGYYRGTLGEKYDAHTYRLTIR